MENKKKERVDIYKVSKTKVKYIILYNFILQSLLYQRFAEVMEWK